MKLMSMPRGLQKLAVGLLFAWTFAFAITRPHVAQDQAWEEKRKAKGHELVQKNGEGTDQALKAELLKMLDADQNIRIRGIEAPKDKKQALAEQQAQIDKELTQRLKEIVAAKGWPTIRLVGIQASEAAALILTHSPDHEFRKQMLPQLFKLVDDDQILGTEVALVADKILVADGKPQRFGTQFNEKDGKLVMLPVEDPDHLMERRQKYLLPPLDVYKKQLADMYHMAVE